MTQKKTVALIYDFDGTLYDGDSTMDFLKYSFKKHPSLLRFLPAMGLAALRHYGFHSIDKTAMKQVAKDRGVGKRDIYQHLHKES